MADEIGQIPASIRPYLWDTPLEDLSLSTHYIFIIERVLEYGDEDAIRWLNTQFEIDKIQEVLRISKRISPRTGNLYARIYQVNQSELTCLQRPYTQKQNRF